MGNLDQILLLGEEIRRATTMQVDANEDKITVFYPDGCIFRYSFFNIEKYVSFSLEIGVENNRLLSVIENKTLERDDFVNFTSNLYIAYAKVLEILGKEQMLRILYR